MQEDWERVAETVKRRRTDLGMSQRAAAFAADNISPTTWGSLETHGRSVDVLTRPKIARALGWTTDSIDRILAGGDPELDGHRPVTLEDRVVALEERWDRIEALLDRLEGGR